MSGYQGYKNWETFNVSVWLANVECDYHSVIRIAERNEGDQDSFAQSLKWYVKECVHTDLESKREWDRVDWKSIAEDVNEWAGIEPEKED